MASQFKRSSDQQFIDDACAFDAGQSPVEALILHCEAFVIDSQRPQDRGVQIVDVNRVFDDVVSVVVGRSVIDPGFESAAGNPRGETAAVMIAAAPSMKTSEKTVTGSAPAAKRADMPTFDPKHAAAAATMPVDSAASVIFAAGSGPAKIKQLDAHQTPNKKLFRAPFFKNPPERFTSFGTRDMSRAPLYW